MNRRRTKIVATLGPATDSQEKIEALIAAGADCFRLNCSHSSAKEIVSRAKMVRAAQKDRPVAILADLQGPKIRLGAGFEKRYLAKDDEIILGGEIPVEMDNFLEEVGPGTEIALGDGAPRLRVEKVDKTGALCKTIAPGEIYERRGMNIARWQTEGPALTPKDLADLAVAVEIEADFIALSFVRSEKDIKELREELERHNSHARIIAKIEKVEAYNGLKGIINSADGIMIARGDYGIDAGHAAVPLMQKDAIRRASEQGKVTITATHMLESMTESAIPTRAETGDVANAVFDGTSAIMLSAETAVGNYPVEAVRAMSEIARAVEKEESLYCVWLDEADLASHPATALMHAAVTLGRDVDAAAIVVPTVSGGSARAAAKYRPKRAIVALASLPQTARQLALEWGVYPTEIKASESIEETLETACAAALEVLPEIISGSWLVITSGDKGHEKGSTRHMALKKAS